jgi:hypothetical protein
LLHVPGEGDRLVPFEVREGVAPDWSQLVGTDVPIHAGGPWVAATAHRLTRRRCTFVDEVGGRTAGVQAAVVEDPGADEMVNLYATLLADPKVWKFPSENLAARPELRQRLPPPERWVPHLSVLYPGFDTFVAADGGAPAALAGSVVDGILGWARSEGMRAVSFPYVRDDSELPEVLAELGLHRMPLTYRSRLSPGGSFDEYVTGLPRKSRRLVQRERRRLAEAGVVTERRALGELWDEVFALRCDLVARYGQTVSTDLETRNLRGLLDAFGEERVRLFCSYVGERVVGFSMYVVWNGTWYAAYTGTYVEPGTRLVYFDHLFYEPIAAAAAEGASTVDLGIGAWQAKHQRGFDLTPVDLWAAGLDGETEEAIRVAAEAMQREVGATEAPAPAPALAPTPDEADAGV